MFYSQCLLSRKGPLSAVWVAAYFHRKLKKDQVTQTDIPFSVDKILLEGVPIITYRVLGYLLLGVVRIYSKKVEYLFDDCHDVLTNIKKASVGKKIDAQEGSLIAPYHSITLPDRFELDAFDFEVMEDAGGSNVLPREEIMLRDTCKDVGIRNYFLDKYHYEAVAVDLETCYIANTPAEDVLSLHLIEIEAVVSPLHSLSALEADMDQERVHDDRSSQGNGLEFKMLCGPIDESANLFENNGKEHQIEELTKVSESKSSENAECQLMAVDLIQSSLGTSTEKLHDSRFSEAECQDQDLEMLCANEEEPPYLVRPSGEENDTNAEQTKLPEKLCANEEEPPYLVRPSGEENDTNADQTKLPEMLCANEEEPPYLVRPSGEENDTNAEQTKLPKMLCENEEEPPYLVRPSSEENDINAEKTKLPEMLCETEEEPPYLVRPSGEENDTNAEQTKLPEVTTLESVKHQVITKDRPLSIAVDTTSGLKFPDASGVSTPESMGIPTPANKDWARTRSKRKCLVDKEIVLPNKVVRESIHDSSGLVRKRMKAPHTVHGVWKAYRIPNLSQDFSEPLIPYSSAELRSLFSNKKVKTKESDRIAEAPDKPNLPGSPSVGRSTEQISFAPETPVQRSATKASDKSPDMSDLPGSLVMVRSPEQTAICQETPLQDLTSMELFEGTDITISDRQRPFSSFKNVEKEPSQNENQEFDLNLMNEELNPSEGDSELNGWSVRTRIVARYLQRSFQNRKKQMEEETVNLMQILRGRTKKESARLFYEILVLKSKGFVDVKQDSGYADILVKDSSLVGAAL